MNDRKCAVVLFGLGMLAIMVDSVCRAYTCKHRPIVVYESNAGKD